MSAWVESCIGGCCVPGSTAALGAWEDDKDDEDDEDNENDEDYDDGDEDDDEDNEDDKDYEDDNKDIFSHQIKVAGKISSTQRWCSIRGVSVDIKQHLCTLSPLYSQSCVKGV